MTLFILGLIIFFGSHIFTALMRDQRAKLVETVGGQAAYRGLYAVAALIGLGLIIFGWRDADASILYTPPPFLRHVVYLLMMFAFILLVAAYAPAGRIAHATKHPMLAGIKIWAFAHLLANGEVRSVLLFGAFLAFAVADRIALKRRNAPIREAGPIRNDVIAVVAGFIAYGVVARFLHVYIAGVPLF